MASTTAASNDDSPSLTLPASEDVSSDGTVAITGAHYSDSFAQANPGAMYVSIRDSSGSLYAWYPGTNGEAAVAGFGSNAVSFSGSYADVQAIINSLTYVATVGSGSDDIHYDIWDQAGVATTGDVPVTVQSAAASDSWLGTVSANWDTGANWSAGAPPASGNSVVIPAGTPFDASLASATLSGETITLAGGVSQPPIIDFNNVTLDSVLLGTGTVDIGGTLTIGTAGTVGLQNTSALASATPTTIVNDGTIVSAAGDRLFIDNGGTAAASGTLVNNGIIAADGGEISIQPNADAAQPESLRNAGTVVIGDGGSMWMNGTFAGGDIAFAGPGTLTLQQGMALASGATITGFGQGDQIDLYGIAAGKGGTLSFANGTLDVSLGGTIAQAIALSGSYTLGNFEVEDVAGNSNSAVIGYAPSDRPSGIASPDIVAPAADAVTQGGTLMLNDVTIDAPGTTQAGLTIVANSGSLFMAGATGSGTDQITVGLTSISQLNADLANLTYVPAAGASDAVVSITALPPAPVATTRSIPIAIGSAGTASGLHEPASESVAAGGSTLVQGSYGDSFAAGNPGALYLGISDSNGTLYGYYPAASGQTVAGGSSTNAISFSGSYSDVEAILNSLTYVAGGTAGSDNIRFDIWNQAGAETTGTVPVTVTGGAAGSTGGATATWTGAVSDDWNTAANWSGNAVPTSGDTVLIAVAKPNVATLSNAVLNGETIILQGSGFSSGIVDFNDVTLNSLLESGLVGSVQIGGTLTIGAQGTLIADADASLTLSGTGEVVVNNGLIASAAGGNVTFYNQQDQATGATLINNGSIDASGAVAMLTNASLPGSPPDWQMTNAGGVAIQNDGAFDVNGTVAGGTIAFNGSGALDLQQADALRGATVTGFGQGDALDLYSGAQGTLAAFGNGTLYVGTGSGTEPIALTGSFALGNFQEATDGAPGSADIVAYAPGGGTSGIVAPGIVTPAQDTVAQGATLMLNDVSIVAQTGGTIDSTGTYSLSIGAGAGTLFMSGASGSGTDALSVTGTAAQLNADLGSLSYMPAAGSSADTIGFQVGSGGPVLSNRWLPIAVTGGDSSGPALIEPSSESVATGGTVAVSGSYADGFAQSNPGELYLGISDGSGTLTATNAAGQAVAGSGTSHIGLSADYVDVNAILASLHYTAGANAGSDTISFEVWNQAGVDTTGATAVMIGGATQGASMTMADFASSGGGGAGSVTPTYNSGGSATNLAMADTVSHPLSMPLALNPGS